jgi:hypothetical protein
MHLGVEPLTFHKLPGLRNPQPGRQERWQPAPWQWPRPADPATSPRTQTDHICTAQLISEKAAHAAPNGGSVRVLLDHHVTQRAAEIGTRTLPGAGSPAPRRSGLHPRARRPGG